MINGLTYEDIITRLREKSGLSEDDLQTKIRQKMDQLSSLISKEGAAYIVANELGIQLLKVGGPVSIKDLRPSMRNLELAGRVQQVYDIREFSTPTGKGKVGSFMLADKTGQTRIVLWHDATAHLSKLKPQDVVRLKNVYVKDNNGKIEVHCNDKSVLQINPEGVEIEPVSVSSSSSFQKKQRKAIHELTETDTDVEIMGTVVQIFDPFFFEICPQCGKRAKPRDGAFFCDIHQEVIPSYSYVMNVVLDDGTDTLRVVFFRNQMERLLEKSAADIIAYKDDRALFEPVKHELLGTMVKVAGKTTKNTMFDRLEFIAQLVFRNPNPKDELDLLSEMEQKSKDNTPS